MSSDYYKNKNCSECKCKLTASNYSKHQRSSGVRKQSESIGAIRRPDSITRPNLSRLRFILLNLRQAGLVNCPSCFINTFFTIRNSQNENTRSSSTEESKMKAFLCLFFNKYLSFFGFVRFLLSHSIKSGY